VIPVFALVVRQGSEARGRLRRQAFRPTIVQMGQFRPARKVSCVNGDYWELYASKTALPSWRQRGGMDSWGDPRADTLALPLAVIGAIWGMLIAPLARFLVLLPFAVVRGRRSRAIRVEAVRTFPDREVLLWTTTDGRLQGVLDEIAAGLAAGKVVQPEGAVYSGREG
jgi:hypothetical protein